MNIISQKHNFTKFVNKSDYSYNNIMKFKQTTESAYIYNELDHDLNNDPSENYDILENHIKSAIEEPILSNKIRFNEYIIIVNRRGLQMVY